MNNTFKPLTFERKVGLALAVVAIIAFAIGCAVDDKAIVGPCLMIGLASFVTVIYLMARSVDDDKSPREENNGEPADQPPRIIEFNEQDADRRIAGHEQEPEDLPTAEPVEDDEEWQDIAPYHRNTDFQPLNGWRKAGIAFAVGCIASFLLAGYATGVVQGVFVVIGALLFMGIFVLMGKDLDEQRQEFYARRKKRNHKDDDENKDN